MSLEKVVERIREDGAKSAESVRADARKQADALLADGDRRAAVIAQKRAAELAVAIDALKRRETAGAELDAKKLRLAAQMDVLGKLRAQALAKLSQFPQEKRILHIQSLAKSSTIANGSLLVAQRDLEAAKKAGLKVSGVTEALGGVIVVSDDGSTREDLRYETLFDEVWREGLKDTAETVFGKV